MLLIRINKNMQQFIKETALSLGFDACGIARAEALTEDAVFLRSWLDAGMHGEMSYLARNFEKRTDPRELVPGCKSVVTVLLNYCPPVSQPADAPRIARYAFSEIDYHTVIKGLLAKLEAAIVENYGSECINSNVQHSFVDSAPVLERRWAQRAGLGWIGKHTQLISPEMGSWFFIGVLMLNVETEYDIPVTDRCGSCTRCIDACPTQALQPHLLNATRCISYQTIELKAPVVEEIRPLLSGFALGCDICVGVCPWNRKKAVPYIHSHLKANDVISAWKRDEWSGLESAEFNQIFKHSAIKRAGFAKLKENIGFLNEKKSETS